MTDSSFFQERKKYAFEVIDC